ncbi:uncharacterized protein LDX57_011548 [Aspergillus melleus]|uniref:uncharacterized protein n=1 Tax=Aspergillus melleus TaxID=138277 RepID=UPI001E8CC6B1|nr:uncharacterized protein LDX57_011548 [Aspergillus melleus]KAH8433912.1 hypothetical protein LDX57_011548 [Aspergillus melleus]
MMFYRNLSLRRNTLISNIILGFCSIWIVLGTVLLGVRCSSKSWENIDNSCAGLYPRWQTVCALDIILEIAILAYPVKIIYNVQIAFVKKIKVLCILSCRVVLIPISAIHLIYINTQTASPNPSLDGAYATTVAELHIGLSVILLTISSLKVFVAAYEDDQGFAYTDDGSKSHSQSGRPTRPGTWRASRPAKDPMFSTPAWDEEPILRSSVPSSRSHDMGALGGGAIMKSVQISVTRESIELEDRGAKAASASAEVSGAL